MKNYIHVLLILTATFIAQYYSSGQDNPPKKILVVVEGNTDLKNYAMGDGRQLATLLGHFNAVTTLKGVNKYIAGEVNNFDYTFYIGFYPHNLAP